MTTRDRILDAIRKDPGISIRGLAARVNLSASATHEQVQHLMADGRLAVEPCPGCGRRTFTIHDELNQHIASEGRAR